MQTCMRLRDVFFRIILLFDLFIINEFQYMQVRPVFQFGCSPNENFRWSHVGSQAIMLIKEHISSFVQKNSLWRR